MWHDQAQKANVNQTPSAEPRPIHTGIENKPEQWCSLESGTRMSFTKWIHDWSDCTCSAETFLNPVSAANLQWSSDYSLCTFWMDCHEGWNDKAQSSSNEENSNLWSDQRTDQWSVPWTQRVRVWKRAYKVHGQMTENGCNWLKIRTELIVSFQKRYDMCSFDEWTSWPIWPGKFQISPMFSMGIEINICIDDRIIYDITTYKVKHCHMTNAESLT